LRLQEESKLQRQLAAVQGAIAALNGSATAVMSPGQQWPSEWDKRQENYVGCCSGENRPVGKSTLGEDQSREGQESEVDCSGGSQFHSNLCGFLNRPEKREILN